MAPVEFETVVERSDALLASAQAALRLADADPPAHDDEAQRDAILLCLDAVAVVDAAQRMLRRTFVDSRGAVLRRIIEAGMIASSEAAAAIGLWGPGRAEWERLQRDCEQCRDAMRTLLSSDVHDPGELSGAT